ncbi:hypothetical protein PSQ90_11875 [Devosia rhodophyticola]|uniref:Peptidase M15 n=1 Tax=Devosia rhodophyticola TaxID=3026423 RepID=A0ABY7YVM6_9HYPH|nr:hypothetical protein [Devosia rhodophyticola]WDR04989.1 hypothetical protein PSQ90_11875 [Devosia rhodophyticola]
MRKPQSVKALEAFGRTRLSQSFFMRDFLFSEIAAINGFSNIPDDPDLAIAAGTALCENLLEPLQARFGRISIRSAYRAPDLNHFGNLQKLNCAANHANHAGHIWDRRDEKGNMGACACIIINRAIPYFDETGDWEALAWWVHDSLPYHSMQFFPRYAAFNLTWRERPIQQIYSYIPPRRGWLTRPGMANHPKGHAPAYKALLTAIDRA